MRAWLDERRGQPDEPLFPKLSAAAVLVLLGTGVGTRPELTCLDRTASAATSVAAGHTVPGLPGPPSMTAPAVAGTVASVNTTTASFTVLTRTGTTETVDVTSSTSPRREPGVKSAALTTLKKGDHVMVQGGASPRVHVPATAMFIGNGAGRVSRGRVVLQLGGPGGGGPGPSGPGGSGHRPGPGGGRYPGGPAGNGQAPAVSETVEVDRNLGGFFHRVDRLWRDRDG